MNNEDILKVKKQLLPTGRAFKVPTGGVFESILLGRGVKESEVYNDTVGILDSLIPDNGNFSEDDCKVWEKTLSVSPAANLADRKAAIYRKMQFPSNVKGRQHKNYLEYQLNQAGFICKVYEWFDIAGLITSTDHSTETIHSAGTLHSVLVFPSFTQVVANFIEPEKEEPITLNLTNAKSIFWISGLTFNSPITIPSDRIAEFRHIILTIKPLHSIGLIQTT